MTDITWLEDCNYPEDGLIGEKTGETLFEDDDWEDEDFEHTINDKFPGWYLVKMLDFKSSTFAPVEEWCRENVSLGEWNKVGWSTGCSYSVGVVFSHPRDAMMFKLRWR